MGTGLPGKPAPTVSRTFRSNRGRTRCSRGCAGVAGPRISATGSTRPAAASRPSPCGHRSDHGVPGRDGGGAPGHPGPPPGGGARRRVHGHAFPLSPGPPGRASSPLPSRAVKERSRNPSRLRLLLARRWMERFVGRRGDTLVMEEGPRGSGVARLRPYLPVVLRSDPWTAGTDPDLRGQVRLSARGSARPSGGSGPGAGLRGPALRSTVAGRPGAGKPRANRL